MIRDSGAFDLLVSEGNGDLSFMSILSGDLDFSSSTTCSERSGDFDFLSRKEPILRGNPKLILFSILEASSGLVPAFTTPVSMVGVTKAQVADGLGGKDFVNLKEKSSASTCAVSSNVTSSVSSPKPTALFTDSCLIVPFCSVEV